MNRFAKYAMPCLQIFWLLFAGWMCWGTEQKDGARIYWVGASVIFVAVYFELIREKKE